MSLQRRALSAFGWSGAEKLGQALSGTVVQLVLARLLAPADFALIAMLAVFMELGRSFVDSGLTAALIQSRRVSQEDLSSVFFFNILAAVGLGAVLVAGAPAVARFYGQPLLRPMLMVLSLRLLFDALGRVHSSLLSRQIDQRSQAGVRLPATVIGGIVGIGMALTGFGAWALVGQLLSQALSRSALFWVRSSWRPSWVMRLGSLRRLAPFGSRVFLAALLDKIGDNLYLIVIGKRFPPAALGYYFQARKYQAIPSQPLAQTLTQILFPVFSEIQEDDVRLRRGLAKGVRLLSFFYFPVMLGLAASAEPLIVALVTAKWLPAVPYLQLLCFASLSMPLHALNLNAVKAKGDSGAVLRLVAIKRAVELGALVFTFRWGIGWMIGGQIASSLAGLWINARVTRRLVGFGLAAQARASAPYLACSTAMAALVYTVNGLTLPSPWLLLAIQLAGGAALYLTLTRAFGLAAPGEALELLKRQRSR